MQIYGSAGFLFLRYCFSGIPGNIGTLVTKLFPMKIIAPLFFFGLLCNFSVNAQREYTPEEEAFFSKAMSLINAKHVRWIKSTAQEANQKNLAAEEVQAKANSYGILGGMRNLDIEAMAFLVLMQASKSAQEDLKAIMAQVKSINNQKKKMREALTSLEDPGISVSRAQIDSFNRLLIKPATSLRQQNNQSVTKQEINNLRLKMKNDLDSMSEMGEMESLRMQMLMDRRSKIMSTLSNLLKKISQTQDNIISNLK